MQGKLLEKDKLIAELEAKKIIMDKKNEKIEIKRDNMEEAMQDITNELCQMCVVVFKQSRGEKYVVVAVVMSWLIFVIVLIVSTL